MSFEFSNYEFPDIPSLPEAFLNPLKRNQEVVDYSHREKKKVKTELVFPIENAENVKVSNQEELMQYITEWPAKTVRVRDGGAREDELSGALEWKLVEGHDHSDENLKLLAQLKQLISINLTEMPKIYIMRLVFDLQHKSIIGMKSGNVIGGITFRPFVKEGYVPFIEIVFCVISKSLQRGGYGSRLMNHLKNWCTENNIFDLLTFADDTAIGYFERQGFSSNIGMDDKDWNIGFLKSYVGATLMHCLVDKRIDYLQINQQNRIQRATFCKKMRQLSNQHIEYEGIKKVSGTPLIDHTKVRGLIEAGWDPACLDKLLEKENQDQIYRENKALLEQIKKKTSLSAPFTRPVIEILTKAEGTKYLEIVSDPIDLRTISEKLAKRVYICPEMMLADLHRMIDNCKAYLKSIYNDKQKLWEQDPLYIQAESLNVLFLKNRSIELRLLKSEVIDNNEEL
jgi:histone acetyltransferase